VTADPEARVAIAEALKDPRVGTAFADAIAQIHAAVLGGGSEQVRLDARALTAALRDAIARRDPVLAAEFERGAQTQPLDVELGGNDLPHFGNLRDRAGIAAVLGALAALLLVTASLLMWHERKAFTKLGRRVAYLSIIPLLGFVVAPRVLDLRDGDAEQIGAAVLRAYGSRVVPSAVALLVTGLIVVVASLTWARRGVSGGAPVPAAAAARATSPWDMPTAPPTLPTEPAITEKLYL
jgi:hypothetical protein